MPTIKRRSVLHSLLAAPVAVTLAPELPAQETSPPPPVVNDQPHTPTVQGSASCPTVRSTFTEAQFQALHKLAELIVPAQDDVPGAVEAGVPEFLDFLIGVSPEPVVTLYKQGLDRLNSEARKKYGKAFHELAAEQTEPLLSALRAPWTYDPPADGLARFLLRVKSDLLTGTRNSQDYILVVSQRRRSAGGVGQYWHPID